MKAQVYKDPRPGRVLRALPRALALARPGLGLRGRAGRHHALRLDLLPHARDRGREGARRRRGDPRAEPLLVHGPLLPRRLAPAQGALHGQVAAVHAAACSGSTRTAACSRCGAATPTRTRSSPPRGILERGGDGRDVLRGRPLAHRQAVREAQARHRPAGADDRRADRADRDPRLLEGAQLEAAAVPEGHGPLRRPDRAGTASRTRRASSSRPSPTRSSRRSRRSTPSSRRTAARASRAACASCAAPSARAARRPRRPS